MVADNLADYLFARSTGHFALLMTLITRGCRRAIRAGVEELCAGGCGCPERPHPYSGVTLSDEGGSGRTHADPPICTVRGFGGGLEAAAQDQVICAGER
jgi:hypothetical protein